MAKTTGDNPNLAPASIVLEHAIADYARSLSILDIPRDRMAVMLSAGLSKLRDLPRDQLAGLSSSSATVTDAVKTGFAAAYGGLSAEQLRDLRLQQSTGQPIGVGGADIKGRILIDGVTGYVDRDGRKVEARDRHSSADYEKLPGSGTTDRNALNFARELGVDPSYAGFFNGASSTMRNAVTDFMRNGAPITDDHVRNMNDVSAVIGLVRAGKIKPDDPRLPPSVQQIIKDMKAKGIDPATADQQTIRKYLKDHPDALQAAKTEVKAATGAVSGLADNRLVDTAKAQVERAATAAPSNKAASPRQPPKPVQTVPKTM
jgi:hypothetical protein